MSAAALAPVAGRLPAGSWIVDPTHSTVGFSVVHLGITLVSGRFRAFSGSLIVDGAGRIVRAGGGAEVQTIDTGVRARDRHLVTPDFFDAARHPIISFAATGGTAHGRLDGELTIRGHTGPVSFALEVTGEADDPWGARRLGLRLRTELSRRRFGLTYAQLAPGGVPLIGDRVGIVLDLSLTSAEPG